MDNEINGSTGTVYDYGMRIYDARIAKFLSVDPLSASFPYYTPYQFAGNKPIWAIDLDGLEERIYTLEIHKDKAELKLIDEDLTKSPSVTVHYKNTLEFGSWWTNGKYKFHHKGYNSFGTQGQNKVDDFYLFADNHINKEPAQVAKIWEHEFVPNWLVNLNGYGKSYQTGKSGSGTIAETAGEVVKQVGKYYILDKNNTPVEFENNYAVVLGSFTSEENAFNYAEQNGSNLMVLQGVNNDNETVYRVAGYAGDSRSEAESKRSNYRDKEETSNAWILTAKEPKK